MKILLLKFLLLTIPSFCVFSGPKDTPKVVEVQTAVKENIEKTTTLIGRIQAKKSVLLVAKNIGILSKCTPSGQSLKKGDVIARLDNEDVAKSFDLALQAETIAKTQYERTCALAAANAVHKQALEDAKNQWIGAQKNFLSAKQELEKNQFIAPFDGIVGNYKAREEAQVQLGDAVVSFYDPSNMLVEFDIPAYAIENVTVPCDIKIEGRPYTLKTISKTVDPDTYMVPAICDIENTNYFSGQMVDVLLPIESYKNVITLSSDAIFLKEGKPSVYKVIDGKTQLQQIEVGLQEKNKTQITSGVNEGDIVVLYGQDRLYPDTAVEIEKKK